MIWEDTIVCPYCKRHFSNPEEYVRNGDVGIIQCCHCEKHIKVEVEYEVSYRSFEAPCMNGGEHDWYKWRKYGDEKDYRACRICDRREYRPQEVQDD
jgi:hypothetical protein